MQSIPRAMLAHRLRLPLLMCHHPPKPPEPPGGQPRVLLSLLILLRHASTMASDMHGHGATGTLPAAHYSGMGALSPASTFMRLSCTCCLWCPTAKADLNMRCCHAEYSSNLTTHIRTRCRVACTCFVKSMCRRYRTLTVITRQRCCMDKSIAVECLIWHTHTKRRCI